MPRHRIGTIALILISLAISACGSSDFKYQRDESVKLLATVKTPYPDTRFAVISDLHYHDPSLGVSGSAFQAYLDKDRKMLTVSFEIMTKTVDLLSGIDADFIIVCGDMTKDGERVNHQVVASHLKMVADTGKKVIVVPGNHDIANGESFRYQGNESLPVPSVSAEEFREIYRAFGFGTALKHDPSSLSYVTEPVPGLWIFALDSCRWKENEPHEEPVSGSRFSAETLAWLEDALIASKKENKAVMAVMHHGIWEHYTGNAKYYAKNLVDDYKRIASMMAAYSVAMVFSGHFHSQDITRVTFEAPNRFLFDIETGSLVTYPCPYRVITVSNGYTAKIESHFIRSTPSYPDFYQHAQRFCYERSVLLVSDAMKKFRMSPEDIARVNSKVADALMSHLVGDETSPESPATSEGMGLWGKIIFSMRKDLVEAWHKDLYPADNQVTIDLKTGNTI